MQKQNPEFTQHPVLARRVGIDSRTLRDAVARGDIKGLNPIQVGKRVIYRTAEVEAWIGGNKQGGAA